MEDNQLKASATFENVTWQDVRRRVESVNPKLCKIIDSLDPSKQHTLYKATYPYGTHSVIKGVFHLPDQSEQLIPITSSNVTPEIKESLSYNALSNPVCLILKNVVEVYLETEKHTIPIAIVPAGKLLSSWRVLSGSISQHPAFLWNVSAGTRSIFMLPKISSTSGIQRLKRKYRITLDTPRSLLNHGALFSKIHQSNLFEKNWETEILFFSKEWFGHLHDNAWQDFHYCMLEYAWQGSEYHRNSFVWQMIYSLIQKQANIKPNPYITDTIHHLLAISSGNVPGFSPAINDNLAPINKLQEAFSNIYQLDYAPIIMQPQYFNLYSNCQPVYYSLQYPATIQFSPRSKTPISKISDLHDIQYLLQKYLKQLSKKDLNIRDTPIYNSIQKVMYDFFHLDNQLYEQMKNTKTIPEEDENFTISNDRLVNKPFPHNSPFLLGCIRVSHRKL